MATTLSDVFMGLQVRATMTDSLDLKTRNAALAFARSVALDHGTGAGQIDKVWDDVRQIAASSNDDPDLAPVTGGDAFGAALTFARLKGIFVAADPTNVNNVVVGGAAAAQFIGPFGAAAHTVHVRPGGWLGMACSDATGWLVTATTADVLRIANGGAGTVVNYAIVLLGCSA